MWILVVMCGAVTFSYSPFVEIKKRCCFLQADVALYLRLMGLVSRACTRFQSLLASLASLLVHCTICKSEENEVPVHALCALYRAVNIKRENGDVGVWQNLVLSVNVKHWYYTNTAQFQILGSKGCLGRHPDHCPSFCYDDPCDSLICKAPINYYC